MQYIVLVREAHHYKKFISDLSGQDPHEHRNDPGRAMKSVRNWLGTISGLSAIPSASFILEEYQSFRLALPNLCKPYKWNPDELTFQEYGSLVDLWLNPY
jgi:hypothetical protein